ncbi:CocE/NonD hydrolase [Stemphylium lycopersici]|uniref:CocE/NonD hydrolase n=1 Tax=Stemphylium lycopersici TaxID=183478 RepID=A0A364N3Q6_STELY|nr:CocE/NonD hydrolase [Stemphylium lycopersici]RAR10790.1 CocE/NonD hydrolase [Stemphylium lycopersici]
MSTTKRGVIAAFLDRLATRQLGFPPETCSYTVQGVRIPVLNGGEIFELAADLYLPLLPQGEKPVGTILIRCPYGRGPLFAILSARPYAARGYQCLLVSCRGTFGSGGEFEPWRNEEEDGHAVVAWMRQQSWYTGSFATSGGSYLGFVQWALLKSPPSDMVAAVIQCAPHDFGKQLWGTGSLALEWISWAENILRQEETGIISTIQRLLIPKMIKRILGRFPMAASIKAHFSGRAPWLDYVVDHPDTSDPFYNQLDFTEALEHANIPILLVSGWYDVFMSQTMEQYTRLSERNTNVALLMGPWNHMQVGRQTKAHQKSFHWLEEHLRERITLTEKSPVQYFVTGADLWQSAQRWPPLTSEQQLFLRADGRLSGERPSLQEGSSQFTFNPNQPTPTIGGNLLLGGGSMDDTALASRSDVITFTTETLDKDVEVAGKIAVQLSYSSDNPDIDVFARISQVDNKGHSRNITETYKRLGVNNEVEIITLHLNDCAHRSCRPSLITDQGTWTKVRLEQTYFCLFPRTKMLKVQHSATTPPQKPSIFLRRTVHIQFPFSPLQLVISIMSKPKVLIIGCGAVGLTQGYILSSGADITYLVRTGRTSAFQPPKKLYDYKDDKLHVFSDYRVVESVDEVADETFYCILDTLDGHTVQSQSGISTLQAVGGLIRKHAATFVAYSAIGLDIDEHYARTLGVARERLMPVASMLAHQPTSSISLPDSATADLARQADMLYSHMPPNYGLIVFNSQPKLTRALADVYEKHARLRIQVLPGFIASSGFLLGILQLVAWALDGFHPFPEFRGNKEIWGLLVRAQREVLRMPRFGWLGWFASLLVGSWATGKMMTGPVKTAVPLAYHEFNAFHHGSKVIKQDVKVLEDLVMEGEKAGMKMVALREILRRAERIVGDEVAASH